MADNTKDPKGFSLEKRVEGLTNASRGIYIFLATTHNAWIHCSVFALTLCAGWYFGITQIEWAELIFVGGMVLVAEAFNTAIEIDMDLTSPEYHPFARDTKDVAAGAVLISALTATCVGIIIFVPYVFALFH